MKPRTQKPKLAVVGHFLAARWRWCRLRGGALVRFQEGRARAIVRYAHRHAPYYRQLWDGHDIREWRTLPVVDKQAMMLHFNTFNTRGVRRDRALEVALRAERERDFRPTIAGLTVGLSSGTSGHRGLFLVSPAEQAAWAGTILARTLHHVRRQGYRVAFFLRSNSNLYEQVGSRLVHFRYFDLMLPLEQAVAALNQFQPDLVVGPPSLLGLLAHAREGGTLQVAVERLISVAEVLEPQDRRRLETVFAAPVHQIYQCTEGLLAVSCKDGALHIQEDLVALQFEPLAGSEDRVTPLVTDLWRTTQPIIRYRLKDVLVLDPAPCTCGSSFRTIRAVEGRCDDLVFFTGQDGSPRPFFSDTIRRMILLASDQIVDYQAVQEGHGQLRIHLEVPPASSFADIALAVRMSIMTTLAQYACRPASLQIEEGLVPVAAGAKRRRIQCLY